MSAGSTSQLLLSDGRQCNKQQTTRQTPSRLLLVAIILLALPTAAIITAITLKPPSVSPVVTAPRDLHHPQYTCAPNTTVHVVFSNHLDIGFHAYSPNGFFAANVVQQGINQWLISAINYDKEMSSYNSTINPYHDRFRWMAHPWIISLALDCPPNMNYTCLTSDQRAAVIDAMRRGVIWMHAFPFNSEAEMHSTDLFEYGIEMTHRLAAELGLPPPRTISQRDVPGTTKAVIPHMITYGVYAFSIGVNGAAQPAKVPPVFVWKTSDTESEQVIILYHAGGIGVSDAVIIPGFPHIALFDWNGDNSGPKNPQQYLSDLAAIRRDFSGCNVTVSTFDEFVIPLYEALQAGTVTLPIYTEEIADTWSIYGAGSDPLKTAQFRTILRLRSLCLTDGACDSDSPAFHNFSRLLMKGGEHTWGADVKSVLKVNAGAGFVKNGSYYQWSNVLYEGALARPEYQTLLATWFEQRRWVVDVPLSALPATHPIAVGAAEQFRALRPSPTEPQPSRQGYQLVDPTTPIHTPNNWTLLFGEDGAIHSLVNTVTKRTYATVGLNSLGSLVYQAWTEQDINTFLSEYCYIDPHTNSWVLYDYGKAYLDTVVQPNITRHETAILQDLYYNAHYNDPLIVAFWIMSTLPDYLVETYGGWQRSWTNVVFNTTSATLDYTVILYRKTPTRIPESLFFTFSTPTQQYPLVHKLSSWVDTGHITPGGSQHLHGVTEQGVDVPGLFTVHSPDVALVSLGYITPFPSPMGNFSDMTNARNISFSLFNNIWGTNYPESYPFTPEDANIQYRFQLQLH